MRLLIGCMALALVGLSGCLGAPLQDPAAEPPVDDIVATTPEPVPLAVDAEPEYPDGWVEEFRAEGSSCAVSVPPLRLGCPLAEPNAKSGFSHTPAEGLTLVKARVEGHHGDLEAPVLGHPHAFCVEVVEPAQLRATHCGGAEATHVLAMGTLEEPLTIDTLAIEIYPMDDSPSIQTRYALHLRMEYWGGTGDAGSAGWCGVH